jgi:LmbE family N-acetylglucosaminyl deacetylase
MNVLVIAPHPDDEAIGCGGTVRLHAARGDRVFAVFLTSGELGLRSLPREQAWRQRETEAQAAADILGIADLIFLRRADWLVGECVEEIATALRSILCRELPGLIYLPHAEESHPDHKASLPVVLRALQESDYPLPVLRCYEFWTPLAEHDHVEDISETMGCKLRAIRCYRSQLAQIRYDRAVRALNQYRGLTAAKCRFAEVFKKTGYQIHRDSP